DPDLSEDARVDREVPLAVRALLRLALPDRAQPRDGPLPCEQALAAGGGRSRAGAGRGDLCGGGRARVDRPQVDAGTDRGTLAGAAAGADAEVRVQLRERRGCDDPRQDRGRDQVAPAPGTCLAAE